jgi:beta-aspartyl-peptidase (threonine type)
MNLPANELPVTGKGELFMKMLLAISLSIVLSVLPEFAAADAPDKQPIAIAVHGGAGTIKREDLSEEKEKAVHAALNAALDTGHAVLANGGTSLDAVSAAVQVLEDSPHFNAGKGAVFTCDGHNELDAAIMDGATLDAGAVAGLKRVKNPIRLARLVMDESPHVLLFGEGAESFGRMHEVEFVSPDYFHTDHRWEQLLEVQERQGVDKDSEGCGSPTMALDGFDPAAFGTVGAVALDQHGNIAAATSTGGMTNKRYGRVGDVPLVGAGTYADNATAALSATGHGEYFIRTVAAHSISERMRHLDESLEEASRAVIFDTLKEMGGGGGVIGVDAAGNLVQTFNTTGMYRGYIDREGKRATAIYED